MHKYIGEHANHLLDVLSTNDAVAASGGDDDARLADRWLSIGLCEHLLFSEMQLCVKSLEWLYMYVM